MNAPRRTFAALLEAAAHDAAAAAALAEVYAGLDAPSRERLLEAALDDAQAERLALAPSLLVWLSVEREPRLAARLAAAVRRRAGGLQATTPARALEGRRPEGESDAPRAVFLVRPLHGDFVETVAASWDAEGRVERARFEPLRHEQEADRGLEALPDGLAYAAVPFAEGLDLLVRALWGHRRRHGTLPAAAAPLAAFLRD